MDEKLDSCTCPSGDGSLRWPCPAHPATLATVKHGGCVQLGDGLHVTVLREMRARLTDSGSPARTAALDAAIGALSVQSRISSEYEEDRFATWAVSEGWDRNAMHRSQGEYKYETIRDMWRAWQAALSAQPSLGGQGDALLREVSAQLESLDCGACIGSDAPMEDLHGRIAAHLAARQPVGAVPQGCDACDRTGIRQNDEGRNIFCPDCDLGRACAGDAGQPSLAGHRDVRAQFEEYRGGDFKRDAHGYYTNPRTAQDWAMWQTALGARQPVGEPVGYATFRDGRFGSWLFQTRAMAESHDSTAVAGGPANSEIVPLFRPDAQAVDLGQLERFDMEGVPTSRGLDVCNNLCADGEWVRFDDVKALIDIQAVGK